MEWTDALQTQIFTPYFCLISERYAFGSGKLSGSNVKEHHSYCFIQKQSRWKTRTGHFLSVIPCKKPDTVFSS